MESLADRRKGKKSVISDDSVDSELSKLKKDAGLVSPDKEGEEGGEGAQDLKVNLQPDLQVIKEEEAEEPVGDKNLESRQIMSNDSQIEPD